MSHTTRIWLVAWLGMMVLAILNGGLRDWLLVARMSESAAHQVSTLTLLGLFAGYFVWLARHWPIGDAAQAWTIGLTWCLLTVAFEIGLGRATGVGWADLLYMYDITTGSLWVLIPLATLIGPALARKLTRRTALER